MFYLFDIFMFSNETQKKTQIYETSVFSNISMILPVIFNKIEGLSFLRCFGNFLNLVGVAPCCNSTLCPFQFITASLKWSEQVLE